MASALSIWVLYGSIEISRAIVHDCVSCLHDQQNNAHQRKPTTGQTNEQTFVPCNLWKWQHYKKKKKEPKKRLKTNAPEWNEYQVKIKTNKLKFYWCVHHRELFTKLISFLRTFVCISFVTGFDLVLEQAAAAHYREHFWCCEIFTVENKHQRKRCVWNDYKIK